MISHCSSLLSRGKIPVTNRGSNARSLFVERLEPTIWIRRLLDRVDE